MGLTRGIGGMRLTTGIGGVGLTAIIASLSCWIAAVEAVYQPGTPGAQWTETELVIIKGKLREMFKNPKLFLEQVPGGADAQAKYDSLKGAAKNSILPDAPKVIRLTFHDCVPDSTGAGCNGCFNFKNVGNLYKPDRCAWTDECDPKNEDIGATETDNNNLYWLAEVLEYMYTNATFGPPDYSQHLSESLRDSGKSRSDFWAYAGQVAVQAAAESTQKQCNSERLKCSRMVGGAEIPCSYIYPYSEFKTGRIDCVSDCSDKEAFCTTASEVHPNPHGNGTDTTAYFKNNFGMTVKETVALMGVHTLGNPHHPNSGNEDSPWAGRGFDNAYFQNLVNDKGYRELGMGEKDDEDNCIKSRFFGDEYGNPFNVEYRVRSQMRKKDFGPFNWNLFGRDCDLNKCEEIKEKDGSFHINSCCNADRFFKGCPGNDPKCEQDFRRFFMINMLSVDMGLYKSFVQGKDGKPNGCPGMDQRWLDNKVRSGVSNPAQCPKNEEQTEDGKPMYQVVENYANDVQLWINDFVPAYLKMLEQGYNAGDLTPASNVWFNAQKRGGIWQAFSTGSRSASRTRAEGPYQPGTPGAPWSEFEAIVAKAKIREMLQNPKQTLEQIPGGAAIQAKYEELNKPSVKDSVFPDIAKVVRLAFHDCVPEETGAGCNGCFNFQNVGNMYQVDQCSWEGNCPEINENISPTSTDNNNLYWVAEVLEHIYTNATFGLPGFEQHFEKSLYESGKSRSDLWAFASLVALQAAAEATQSQCNKDRLKCSRMIDNKEVKCSYVYPYSEFKTGRIDCASDCTEKAAFCTKTGEVHPSPHGNGTDTTDYFKKNFELTSKQTIALMGVHTLGHPHEPNSGFRHYAWTSRPSILNCDYFIALKNGTGFREMTMGEMDGEGNCIKSRYFGDENGNPFNVEYRVRSEMRQKSFGPFNWNLFGRDCDFNKCEEIKKKDGSFHINSCCNADRFFKGCPGNDPKCEQDFRRFFMINMLSVDIGLHKSFVQGKDGKPIGCPGMDDHKKWLDNKVKSGLSNPTQCPKNEEQTEDGEPMYKVVEGYADDCQKWIDDFVPVFLKMIENGYKEGDLTPAPRAWFDAKKFGGIWSVKIDK